MKNCSYVGLSELLDLAEVNSANLIKFSKGRKILRGNFIHDYIKVCYSNVIVRMEFSPLGPIDVSNGH